MERLYTQCSSRGESTKQFEIAFLTLSRKRSRDGSVLFLRARYKRASRSVQRPIALSAKTIFTWFCNAYAYHSTLHTVYRCTRRIPPPWRAHSQTSVDDNAHCSGQKSCVEKRRFQTESSPRRTSSPCSRGVFRSFDRVATFLDKLSSVNDKPPPTKAADV